MGSSVGGMRVRRDRRRLETEWFLERRGELPEGGWRRVTALLGVTSVPFFRAFGLSGGEGSWIDHEKRDEI